MRTILKLCTLLVLEPRGVYIGIREEGGQGTNLGPKRGRSRDHTVAAHAALRAARGPVCPLSGPVPDFVFAAPDFDKSDPLGQWLFM